MSLPKTPIKGDAETRRFLEAVRQQVESSTNNALTVNDLRSDGFFAKNKIDVGATTTVAGSPTAPTNLAASGAFENILVTWDYVDYVGHSNTRIYRSLTNVFANAEVVANVEGRIYSDAVGSSKTYYYWVSNVNVDGIESATSQASGVLGATLANTQYLLNALTASIGNTQLNNALGTRITTSETNASTALTQSTSAVTQTSTITARLNNFNSSGISIETNATVTASNVSGLQGQYTVKIDNNGYVTGFGLASTAVNGTPFSDFIVRADRFSISNPSGPSIAPRTPFIVTTTSSVLNGVSVPAGVYIDSAAIQNGSIVNAKIGNATIDDAKISSLSAAKITTGQLDAARITVDGVSLDTSFDGSIGRNRLIIKDLGVTTLKIGGNAVTIPVTYSGTNTFISSAGGNTTVLEMPSFLTVGDSSGGGVLAIYYATFDGRSFVDAGQRINFYADYNDGIGYRFLSSQIVGVPTSNGNTRPCIPVAIAQSISGVQQVKIIVTVEVFNLGTGGTFNSSNHNDIKLCVLGVKR